MGLSSNISNKINIQQSGLDNDQSVSSRRRRGICFGCFSNLFSFGRTESPEQTTLIRSVEVEEQSVKDFLEAASNKPSPEIEQILMDMLQSDYMTAQSNEEAGKAQKSIGSALKELASQGLTESGQKLLDLKIQLSNEGIDHSVLKSLSSIKGVDMQQLLELLLPISSSRTESDINPSVLTHLQTLGKAANEIPDMIENWFIAKSLSSETHHEGQEGVARLEDSVDPTFSKIKTLLINSALSENQQEKEGYGDKAKQVLKQQFLDRSSSTRRIADDSDIPKNWIDNPPEEMDSTVFKEFKKAATVQTTVSDLPEGLPHQMEKMYLTQLAEPLLSKNKKKDAHWPDDALKIMTEIGESVQKKLIKELSYQYYSASTGRDRKPTSEMERAQDRTQFEATMEPVIEKMFG
eukprot:Nk52_evm1s2533 gene=Nk52_evmTU1s2533